MHLICLYVCIYMFVFNISSHLIVYTIKVILKIHLFIKNISKQQLIQTN